MIKTLFWKQGRLCILNQLRLPGRVEYVDCDTYEQVYRAIRDMAVRGAPAIGVTAAYGVALAARQKEFRSLDGMKRYLAKAAERLAASRPTAVNLFWALERMRAVVDRDSDGTGGLRRALEHEAHRIYAEDIEMNRRIGEHGARLLKAGSRVLTHCNAGALATAGYGTALGVIRSAHAQGKIKQVFVDETRPYLQGARLTAWEMRQEKIPYVLITDNMAGHFMQAGEIDAVIVGADRIAASGDVANKIGTYALSVLARYHGVPLYVAAPSSTVDLKTRRGADIVIEERSAREVLYVNRKLIAPEGTQVRHPAFDVTPAALVSAIITERGVFKPRDIKRSIPRQGKDPQSYVS